MLKRCSSDDISAKVQPELALVAVVIDPIITVENSTNSGSDSSSGRTI